MTQEGKKLTPKELKELSVEHLIILFFERLEQLVPKRYEK